MIRLTNKELYEWRQRGATYQEMAEAEGTSKQTVYMRVKAYEKKLMENVGIPFTLTRSCIRDFTSISRTISMKLSLHSRLRCLDAMQRTRRH